MNYESLFNQAVQHRSDHDCSAYPYEEYKKLVEVVQQYKPQSILEIGTGMGFTAAVMALSSPQAHIDTIEKDGKHVEVAKKFLRNTLSDAVFEKQINIVNDSAETALINLNSGYDLIFFDGYQIHYEFLPHYERLLKPEGILFLANNHLKSKTSDKFFEELEHSGKWVILEKFADTTIAQKIK